MADAALAAALAEAEEAHAQDEALRASLPHLAHRTLPQSARQTAAEARVKKATRVQRIRARRWADEEDHQQTQAPKASPPAAVVQAAQAIEQARSPA